MTPGPTGRGRRRATRFAAALALTVVPLLGAAPASPQPAYAGRHRHRREAPATARRHRGDGRGRLQRARWRHRRALRTGPGRTGVQRARRAAGRRLHPDGDAALGPRVRVPDPGPAGASESLPTDSNPDYHEECVDTPPSSAFWGYWYAANGGSWTYSQVRSQEPGRDPGRLRGLVVLAEPPVRIQPAARRGSDASGAESSAVATPASPPSSSPGSSPNPGSAGSPPTHAGARPRQHPTRRAPGACPEDRRPRRAFDRRTGPSRLQALTGSSSLARPTAWATTVGTTRRTVRRRRPTPGDRSTTRRTRTASRVSGDLPSADPSDDGGRLRPERSGGSDSSRRGARRGSGGMATVTASLTARGRVLAAPVRCTRSPGGCGRSGSTVAASRTTNPLLLGAIIGVVCWVVMARRSDAPWANAFRLYVIAGVLVVVLRVFFRIVFGGDQGEIVLVHLPSIPLPGASGSAVRGHHRRVAARRLLRRPAPGHDADLSRCAPTRWPTRAGCCARCRRRCMR